MRKYYIAAMLALTLSSSAFAGGLGGGGTPPAIEDAILSINRLFSLGTQRSDIQLDKDQKQDGQEQKAASDNKEQDENQKQD